MIDPAVRVLAYLHPSRNIAVKDVPSARRLRRAYTLGYVSFVTEPGERGQRVALTPEGKSARRSLMANIQSREG